MDAQTRHNLKQNELAEALDKLRDIGVDARARNWLLLLAAVLVLVVAYKVWSWTATASLESSWNDLFAASQADDPEARASALRSLASSATSANVKAATRLHLASALTDLAERNASSPAPYYEEAAGALSAVFSDAGLDRTYRASAGFMLATTYESLRKFDDARRTYEALSSDPAFDGFVFSEQAKVRLQSIDAIATRVAIQPGSPPPPAPIPEEAPAPIAAPAPSDPPAEPAPDSDDRPISTEPAPDPDAPQTP